MMLTSSSPASSLEARSVADLEDIKRRVETGEMPVEQLQQQQMEMEKRGSFGEASLASCVGEAFEQIPKTLNSKRFLYSDPAINYQSGNFLVPPDDVILITHEMTITATEDSILRVYTEV
jgi:hypothetical protein